MNFNEHNPPHFHARYGDNEIVVNINDKVVEGRFPKRALSLVMEWYEQNKDELMNNWNSMKIDGTYKKIQPLE